MLLPLLRGRRGLLLLRLRWRRPNGRLRRLLRQLLARRPRLLRLQLELGLLHERRRQQLLRLRWHRPKGRVRRLLLTSNTGGGTSSGGGSITTSTGTVVPMLMLEDTVSEQPAINMPTRYDSESLDVEVLYDCFDC